MSEKGLVNAFNLLKREVKIICVKSPILFPTKQLRKKIGLLVVINDFLFH